MIIVLKIRINKTNKKFVYLLMIMTHYFDTQFITFKRTILKKLVETIILLSYINHYILYFIILITFLCTDYNNTTLENEKKLDKSQTPLKDYNVVNSSSTKCILKAQSSTPTVSYHMNSKKSLNKTEINENKNLDKGKLLIK